MPIKSSKGTVGKVKVGGNRKRTAKNKNVVEEEKEVVKPPGQPTVNVVDMAHILRPLAFRRHQDWTLEEKRNLASFMCNRAGIDASDKVAMHRANLTAIFDFWFNEYVNLYETDKDFEKAIDPWQVIVLVRPESGIYIPLLNNANQHIGGGGQANDPKEPIQFMHGCNWVLSIPSGKEDARRVVSYMKGHCDGENIPFEAIVQDYHASIRDA